QAEVEHLNRVLYTIRKVDQIIVTEKKRDELLKSICDTLFETRGYDNTCICLFDESGILVAHAEAGLDKDSLPMLEQLRHGELSDCIKRTLIQSGVVITKVSSLTCGDCPLVEICNGNMVITIRLEHGVKVYGLLKLQMSGGASISKKEQSLLQEVTGDIAFALHNMELEEEHKQMERKLLESEERYRSVIENAHDMIQSVAPDGRFIFVNAAWLQALGYTEAELSDLNVFNIIHPESLAHCQELFAKVMHGESLQNIQATFITKDGREVLVEGSAAPRYVGSDIVATQGIFHDITERRKMEEQLIVTDRLASIGELSSGVAHELNNPLTSVIGFSDLLLDRDLPDDLKQDLEIINREAKRTAGVVKNLLTFARKHETERSSVDINNIIEKVLELRAYEQKVNNVEVNTRFASDLPEIMADGFRLQQVFINIIINAEHFMIEAHRKGTLTITTERAGDIIRASFADDGPGIAKENMGHLFDPFFTTKEVGKGTGLGLSISYGIITEHGGKIYAKSELGKGATFVIELPVTNADRVEAINENSRE
ncbi:MAG: PAS domain S-box protein, partial [Dehalococcoidales bacterium]